ncbi:MAG: MFS transporter [Reinekea sp.]|jgi:MFS family permease|nr:MFS transporter [Reinekea sp.]MDX1472592.1 MFS transporter [Reinekea sp.]
MKSAFTQYRGLPRDLYILATARAIASAGAFIMPMLTLILTQKMGLTAAQAGILVSTASFSYVPGSLLGGKLADTFGRKKIILFAEVVSAVSWIICGFFPESTQIIPFIIVAYLCMGAIDPTSSALITDLTPPEQRKTAFSLSYLGHNMGIAVGPLIAGFLFLNHAQWMFWGDGLTTLVAAVLILLFVSESKPDANAQAHNDKEASVEGSVWPVLLARPYLIWFTLANFLLTFCYAQLFFSLPLQLEHLFGDFGARNFGWVMTVNAVTVLLLTPFVIALTKQIHAIFNVAMAGALFVIGFGAIYWATNMWVFLGTTVIWTLGEILSSTNANAYIASHSPQSHRARINSILPLIFGMGFGIAPVVMGHVVEARGVNDVWLLVMMMSGTGALLMTWLGISEIRREREVAATQTNH